jgi:hypothetical protein
MRFQFWNLPVSFRKHEGTVRIWIGSCSGVPDQSALSTEAAHTLPD